MSKVAQITVSGAAAAAVTLGLFTLMNGLVSHNYEIPIEQPINKIPVVVGEPPIIETVLRELPDTIDNTGKPPEVNLELTPANQLLSTNTQITLPAPTGPTKITITGGDLSGSLLPLVKVQPVYPSRAVNQGISGHCTVSYTVTALGTTANIAVDKSDCTHSAFYKSSIAAAAKFKYQPRAIDGQAIETHGVRNRFTYKFE